MCIRDRWTARRAPCGPQCAAPAAPDKRRKLANRCGVMIAKRGDEGITMTESVMITVNLRGVVRRQGRRWAAGCPKLNVWSQGRSREDAEGCVREAVELWVEDCLARGTLDAALRELGSSLHRGVCLSRALRNWLASFDCLTRRLSSEPTSPSRSRCPPIRPRRCSVLSQVSEGHLARTAGGLPAARLRRIADQARSPLHEPPWNGPASHHQNGQESWRGHRP